MKFRDFAIGVVVGLATAVVIKEVSERSAPYKSADAVLAAIKEQFKQTAPIDGTWIYMKPEQFNNGYTTVPAYRGGITHLIDGETITYEFVADAFNGILLDVKEV
jgi:predicted small secreted protein